MLFIDTAPSTGDLYTPSHSRCHTNERKHWLGAGNEAHTLSSVSGALGQGKEILRSWCIQHSTPECILEGNIRYASQALTKQTHDITLPWCLSDKLRPGIESLSCTYSTCMHKYTHVFQSFTPLNTTDLCITVAKYWYLYTNT